MLHNRHNLCQILSLFLVFFTNWMQFRVSYSDRLCNVCSQFCFKALFSFNSKDYSAMTKFLKRSKFGIRIC